MLAIVFRNLHRKRKFPMGHHIQAFISREELLREIAQNYPTAIVIPLSQGFGILPITDQFYNELPDPQHPDMTDNRFLYLGPKLDQIGKSFSVKAPLAYVETEYFGGTGYQGAVVWVNGQIIFGPAIMGDIEDFQIVDLPDNAINIALRKLGVLKGDRHDEFDAIGLGKHRYNESWIEEMTAPAPEIC
jgi:hypothetical protein